MAKMHILQFFYKYIGSVKTCKLIKTKKESFISIIIINSSLSKFSFF